MTETNMISFKQIHANGNNSYNKPFTIRIEHLFSCSLKTTWGKVLPGHRYKETRVLLISTIASLKWKSN